MEAHELISDLRKQLDDLEAQGHTAVQVVGLRAYLEVIEKQAEPSKEHKKLEHDGMLARYSAEVQQALEMFKAVLETGKAALNSIVIINGGAVIALLGVMSSLAASTNGRQLAVYLALPLLEFGLGVLCGAAGFASRYFSQACYAGALRNPGGVHESWGHRFRNLAIGLGIVGYALFGLAVVNSYNAMVWSFAP